MKHPIKMAPVIIKNENAGSYPAPALALASASGTVSNDADTKVTGKVKEAFTSTITIRRIPGPTLYLRLPAKPIAVWQIAHEDDNQEEDDGEDGGSEKDEYETEDEDKDEAEDEEEDEEEGEAEEDDYCKNDKKYYAVGDAKRRKRSRSSRWKKALENRRRRKMGMMMSRMRKISLS